MSPIATIFGGSGFVGRYVTNRLARQGWRVRVAVRRPNEAGFVRTCGVVGQVEPVFCNIRDDASVAEVLSGADAAVNCVGLLTEIGRNRFEAVQAKGAARIARLAAEAGVRNLVQISAIGADEESDSAYARTKAAGEQGVRAAFPQAVILRPSIIFGPEDGFFNRFASMARLAPVLPIVEPQTRFQPVYVDDVAQAAELAARGHARPGIYELGGPDVESFRALMQRMLGIIRRRRLILGLPAWAMWPAAWALDMVQRLTASVIRNGLITRDQLRQLRRDNLVAPDASGFEALGIQPMAMESVLPDYLWRFRSSGQYTEITESAKHLRS